MIGANDSVVLELVNYLKTNIPELNSVYDEWPDYNQELVMPCASVLTNGNSDYTPQMPTLVSNSGGSSIYNVGFYDLTLTIDIWTQSKEARGLMQERVFDLFAKQFQDSSAALGISLPLIDYNNVIASYSLNGYTYTDSEEASQRDEWRTRISVLVSFPRIIGKIESTMINIGVTQEVDTDIVIP